jgi:DNA-directed RNA polymerase subunit RPC12/RpoP
VCHHCPTPHQHTSHHGFPPIVEHSEKTLKFIARAEAKHGKKFGYWCSVYEHCMKKVNIWCFACGKIFPQSPDQHLRGNGCPSCKSQRMVKPTDQVRRDFHAKHGNEYEYPNLDVHYKKNKLKIPIFHPKCGITFWQTPQSHKAGNGCPHCQYSLPDEVLKKFRIRHGNEYEYPDFEKNYKNTAKKIPIFHPKCGNIFYQRVNHHLAGRGCPYCTNWISNPETRWLDYLGVEIRQHRIKLPSGKWIKPDGYDPQTNTIYEHHGDFHHGNPNLYPADKINPRSKKTFGELYQKTLAKEQAIRAAGYRLVTIWESEWLELEKSLKNTETGDEFLIFRES